MMHMGHRLYVPVFASGKKKDTTAPTCVITCAQTSPTETSPLNFTFTWSEPVTGFTSGDITVTIDGTAAPATLGNFAGSGAVYTADVVPTGYAVTLDIAAGVCTDAAGNANLAATQFAINYLTLWYLAGGITTAQIWGAWRAKGAASLAASYVNLANPGTNDLTAGVAPNWDAVNGWKFTGTQCLNTGLTPAATGRYSGWVKVSAITHSTADYGMMGYFFNSTRSWAIYKQGTSNKALLKCGAAGTGILSAASVTSGLFGLYGRLAYQDGNNIGDTGVDNQSTGMQQVRIGTCGTDADPNASFMLAKMNIQAAILFVKDAVLTTAQRSALQAAMANF